MSTVSERTPIHISAPANVMLMGEHAVLHGYRALACALSPRIHVVLTPRDDDKVLISSALGSLSATLSDFDTEHDELNCHELRFVMHAIRMTRHTEWLSELVDTHRSQGFELNIQSDFSHTVGLGSSAAVVAATVSAVLGYMQGNASVAINELHQQQVFDVGLKTIHAVQKRGSGTDLAASVYGGMVGYTQQPRSIERFFDAAELDNDVLPQLDLWYCGHKTPTPTVIAHIEQAASAFPDLYKGLYEQMHKVTCAAEQAIRKRNWQQLGTLMNMYHGLLDALGVSDTKLSSMIYKSRSSTGVLGSKISGSGLGDCIIILSQGNNAMKDMAPNPDDHIGAQVSHAGLMLHNEDMCSA